MAERLTEGSMPEEPEALIPVDHPIQSAEDDRLERAEQAEKLAETISRLDCRYGAVVSIEGPWGSGKTSFLTLLRHALERRGESIHVVSIEPWVFSGLSDLMSMFFAALGRELATKDEDQEGLLQRLANDLLDVAEAFAKVYLPGMDVVVAKGRKWLPFLKAKKQAPSSEMKVLFEKRNEVVKTLERYRRPIVVTIDDVDRLGKREIVTVFQLVKKTASFPYVIYVLAFDRPRVARILDESWGGRAYLDKIIQVSFTLPQLQSTVLKRELVRGWREIARATDGAFIQELERDTGTKESVLNIVVPLMETIRDVKRLNATVASLWPILGEKVHPADLVVLEALRLFWPGFYAELMAVAADFASYEPTPALKGRTPAETEEIQELTKRTSEIAKENAKERDKLSRIKDLDSYVASILTFLFPQSAGHRPPPAEERRIARPEVLEAYLRHVPERTEPIMKRIHLPADGTRQTYDQTDSYVQSAPHVQVGRSHQPDSFIHAEGHLRAEDSIRAEEELESESD